MLQDPLTKIHAVKESGNVYGEFLFVTVSREVKGQQLIMTLYGLGFHEYRDRWFTDEWHWYQSYGNSEACEGELSKDDAVKQVEARKDEILSYAEKATQSEQVICLKCSLNLQTMTVLLECSAIFLDF